MKTIYENDKDVLVGATILDVSPEDDGGFVSHAVLRTLDGRTFTITGWTYS